MCIRDSQASVATTELGQPVQSNITLTTVINGQLPAPVSKQIVADSEPFTDAAKALIGEVLTYQLTISIPPGETGQVQLRDTLPDGLRYLAGSARLARTFTGEINASLDPGEINAQPSYDGANAEAAFVDVSEYVASDSQTLILSLIHI